jgi:hypothetical protein
VTDHFYCCLWYCLNTTTDVRAHAKQERQSLHVADTEYTSSSTSAASHMESSYTVTSSFCSTERVERPALSRYIICTIYSIYIALTPVIKHQCCLKVAATITTATPVCVRDTIHKFSGTCLCEMQCCCSDKHSAIPTPLHLTLPLILLHCQYYRYCLLLSCTATVMYQVTAQ